MQHITMHHSRYIHVAMATAEPIVANRLLKSIQQALPGFEVKASVLLFGMAEPIKHFEFCIPVDVIDCFTHYPAIVDSRNLCQLHLRYKMNETGGIGFILDDDLSWTMSEHAFITLIEQLKMKGCDMAFSALSGDSPIPKEYTRTSPLLDVLMAISDERFDDEAVLINEYVGGIRTSNEGITDAHHDFYSFKPMEFYRYDVKLGTIKWHDFIDRLTKGRTTTRNIQLATMITPASGRERGGATLILNADVLRCQNDSLRFLNLISRRSDMVMATEAINYNFKLFNTPPMLEHRRDETFDTHDCRKLMGDILGYALVESRDSSKYCKKRFEFNLSLRVEQTILLLIESSKMMKLLGDWLIKHNHIGLEQNNKFNLMVSENEKTISELMSMDLDMASDSFKLFVENKVNIYQLKEREDPRLNLMTG
jgi:hypothetical protein